MLVVGAGQWVHGGSSYCFVYFWVCPKKTIQRNATRQDRVMYHVIVTYQAYEYRIRNTLLFIE